MPLAIAELHCHFSRIRVGFRAVQFSLADNRPGIPYSGAEMPVPFADSKSESATLRAASAA
jgi:hypothetical protein